MRERSLDRQLQRKEASAVSARPTRTTRDTDSYLCRGHTCVPSLNDQWVARLAATAVEASYAKGSILFLEDQIACGVYMISEGRAKLSVGSAHGKSLILGFFGPGAILGIPAAILGRPYGTTAEIVKVAKAAFVPRDDFLKHLRGNVDAAFHIAELLSDRYYRLLRETETISLSESLEQRLARFLVGLCQTRGSSEAQVQLDLGMGQSDVAQMIGVSRETVTRLFSRFKKRHILALRRSALFIHNKAALERLAQFSGKASPALDIVRPVRRKRDEIPVAEPKM